MDKVIYLFGAGASQAELDFQGSNKYTLFDILSKEIYEISKKENKEYIKILDKLGVETDQDIEHIMSLFEGFSNPKSLGLSEVQRKLRNSFRKILVEKFHGLKPKLISTLFHINKRYGKIMGKNGEIITGVLTTNYDSLLEEACKDVFGGINYEYKFLSKEYKFFKKAPPIIKLHGSFNWQMKKRKLHVSKKFETLQNLTDYNCWMPPSVFKKPKQKLYGELWEKGRKLLIDCDVLRIVGSSLRNEDWPLISLIFVSQIQNRKVFDIELIIPYDYAIGNEEKGIKGVTNRLKFLGKLKPITTLPIVSRGDVIGTNVFHYWLMKKINEIEESKSLSNDTFINNLLQGN